MLSLLWPHKRFPQLEVVELQLADHSDSNTSMCSQPLAVHYDGESVEQAVDLNAWTINEPHLPYKTGLDVMQSHPCTAIEYEKKDDAHCVKFICDEKERNK